jgi:hypothetical protein
VRSRVLRSCFLPGPIPVQLTLLGGTGISQDSETVGTWKQTETDKSSSEMP